MASLSGLERIQRGNDAKQLLQHPLLIEAIAGVRDGVIRQWETTQDRDVRDNLWSGLHGAKRIEAWLQAIVEDGMIAVHEAAQQKVEDV